MPRHSIYQLIKIFPFIILVVGCRAPLASSGIRKTLRLDTTVVAWVCNQPYRFRMPGYQSPTVLSLFQIREIRTDSVSIRFDDSQTLRLTYLDSAIVKQETFHGRFTKRGFKIIFSNKRLEIPPFIPIILGKYNVNRITLALGTNNSLVIKNTWNQGGNIFIFGSGDSGTRKSYFTILGSH